MTVNEFESMPVKKLVKLTGIDRHRWSRYFAGAPFTERVLRSISIDLEISLPDLVTGIENRRCLVAHKREENSRLFAERAAGVAPPSSD